MAYLVLVPDSNTVIAVRYSPVAKNPREAVLEVYLHAAEIVGEVLGTTRFMVVYRVSGTIHAAKKTNTSFERGKPPRELARLLRKVEKQNTTLVVEKGSEIEMDSLCSKTSLGRICGPEDLDGHVTSFWLGHVKRLRVDTILIVDKNIYFIGRWGFIRLTSSTTGLGKLIGPYGMINTRYMGYPRATGGLEPVVAERFIKNGREFDVAAAWALYWCRAACEARATAKPGSVVFETKYGGRWWRLELPKEKGLHVAAALAGTLALDPGTASEVVEYAYREKLQPFSEKVVKNLAESVEDPHSILKLASLSYHSRQLLLAIREKLLKALISLPPATVNNILDVPELTAIMFNVVPGFVGVTEGRGYQDISVAEIVDSVFGQKVFYVNGVRVTAVTVQEAIEKAVAQLRAMKQAAVS